MGLRARRALALCLAVPTAVLSWGCGAGEQREQVLELQVRAAPLVVKEDGRVRRISVRRRAARASAPRRDRPRPQPAEAPRVLSGAIGRPDDGRLVNGVQLAEQGPDWVTWDPILRQSPNRPERRWATDALLSFVTSVLHDFRAAHPGAPPVLIGDLSRTRGGVFDKRYGGLGHASHQNGLDADLYYPRKDRTLRAATRIGQVDLALAQDLVDRFVAAGARYAFVGLRTRLRGPRKVVQAIPYHDDHVHVRIFNPRRPR